MGCSIKFVRLNDFAADIDVLDLSADGYALDQDGYLPVAAPIGAKSVHEVITLKLQGTSKDDLAAMTQDIDEKIKQVQWWIDDPGVERYQVWLRVQLENETYPRQAQILNIMPPDKLRVFVPEEINNNFIGAYSLGIERTPFWEMPYPYPTTTAIASMDGVGGIQQLSETIYGDVPARLARFRILCNSETTFGPNKFWVGFRTSRFGGNVANFDPVFPVSDYTLFTDTATAADGDTESGSRTEVSFATNATMVDRVKAILLQAESPGDYRGNFTVLMRARMSDSSTTSRVRILFGAYLYGSFLYRSSVPVTGPATGSNYQIYEMGKINIPASWVPEGVSYVLFTIKIQAERTAGSGKLYMDSLYLIPTDEGMATLQSELGTFSNAPGNVVGINVYQRPNDAYYATLEDSGGVSNVVYSSTTIKPDGHFDLPANGEAPYIIVASTIKDEQSGVTPGCDLGNTVKIEYTYIPRWRTLRGNVT